MFRIVAGEIEYERRPFARIIMPGYSALYDCAVEAIESCDPDKVERENETWRKGVEEKHALEVADLQGQLDAMTERAEHAEYLLDAIDD